MKVVYRKYIKPSKLGNMVVYGGPIGSGTTLAAVRHIVEWHGDRKVFSSLHLKGIDHTLLDLELMMSWRSMRDIPSNAIMFFENAEFIFSSRFHMSEANRILRYIITTLRHHNNVLIFTTHDLKNINYDIMLFFKMHVNFILEPRYFKDENGTPKLALRAFRPFPNYGYIAAYLPINVQKYFKYFDTYEKLNVHTPERIS